MRANIKLALGEHHLRALLRGGEVKTSSQGVMVRIILKDVGFDVIQKGLDDAKAGVDHYEGYSEMTNV